MEKLHKANPDIVVLAVNIDTENKVKEFMNNLELTFPTVLDVKGDVNKNYKVVSIPTSFFIDEKGMIQKKVVGTMEYDQMQKNMENMWKQSIQAVFYIAQDGNYSYFQKNVINKGNPGNDNMENTLRMVIDMKKRKRMSLADLIVENKKQIIMDKHTMAILEDRIDKRLMDRAE